MISNEEALQAAEKLKQYCDEHTSIKDKNVCEGCIFHDRLVEYDCPDQHDFWGFVELLREDKGRFDLNAEVDESEGEE